MKKGDYSDWQQGKKDDEFADKMFKKSWKRRQGIAKATNKLTKEDYDSVAKQDADTNARIGKRARKPSEKAFWKKAYKKNIKKAVTGMDEDYESEPAMLAKKYAAYAKHDKAQSKSNSLAAQLSPLYRNDMAYRSKKYKDISKKYHKKAVTGMDEAKSAPDRVVTASKKAEKGTKWRLQSRNMDSDGSEMELRQGKRVKMTGVFDRHAQDFQMTPAKKNKTDWKAKSKYYDDPKDIMKTVKEEQIDEKINVKKVLKNVKRAKRNLKLGKAK